MVVVGLVVPAPLHRAAAFQHLGSRGNFPVIDHREFSIMRCVHAGKKVNVAAGLGGGGHRSKKRLILVVARDGVVANVVKMNVQCAVKFGGARSAVKFGGRCAKFGATGPGPK